jgi:hypothetical protein
VLLLQGAKKMYPISIEHTGPLSFWPNFVLLPTVAPRPAQVDKEAKVIRYSVNAVEAPLICTTPTFLLLPLLLFSRIPVTRMFPDESNIALDVSSFAAKISGNLGRFTVKNATV